MEKEKETEKELTPEELEQITGGYRVPKKSNENILTNLLPTITDPTGDTNPLI